MARLVNIARVATATTGTGTLTLGAAVDGFIAFDDAGVSDGDVVTYSIEEGTEREIGRGTYTAAGGTLSRDTVLNSTNAGSKISLLGSAQVFITAAAEDIQPPETPTNYAASERTVESHFEGVDAVLATIPGQATETVAGKIEIATAAETNAGSDTTRAVVPGRLKTFVEQAEGDIASAATTNLSTITSYHVRVTGTTTITSFGTATAGAWRLLRFAGALTLTHNATSMILPGSANITTAANDCCLALSLGSGNWIVKDYQRADGSALVSASGGGAPGPAQGRLTLSTGTPVMVSDVTSATTVYYTPYVGQYVPLYDGASWTMTDTGGELSQATTDTTKSPAAMAADSLYDMFVWDDSGTVRATRGPAWSSATARGTGAGTTEITRQDGIWVNAVAITNGPAAGRGTYVGTIRSNASSQMDWKRGGAAAGGSPATLYVWNTYNRVDVQANVQDNTDSWTVTSGSWASLNASTSNRISFVAGLNEDAILAIQANMASSSTASSNAMIGIGYDSTSAIDANTSTGTMNDGGSPKILNMRSELSRSSGLGLHYVQALQRLQTSPAGSFTVYGDAGGSGVHQNSLRLRWRA